MEFDARFKEHIPKVNGQAGEDEEIASALKRYDGQRFVLRVEDDATYVFAIRADGVDYEAHGPGDDFEPAPDDMFAEMDMKRARKLVEKQTLGLLDLPHVSHRNIGLEDVNFAKRLFKEKA